MSRRHPFGRGHPTVGDPGALAAPDLGIATGAGARGVDVERAEV
jgi:hypothetical protein